MEELYKVMDDLLDKTTSHDAIHQMIMNLR